MKRILFFIFALLSFTVAHALDSGSTGQGNTSGTTEETTGTPNTGNTGTSSPGINPDINMDNGTINNDSMTAPNTNNSGTNSGTPAPVTGDE